MRAAFGLVGILVVIGVIAWIMYAVELPYDQAAIGAKQKVDAQLTPLSANGVADFNSSFDMAMQNGSGGRLDGILVTRVTPGGPASTYFGLVKGDVIVALETHGNRTRLRDISDSEMAKAQLIEAYQLQGTIVVVRNGQEIVLPQAGKPPAPAAPAAAKKSGDGLQGQLDAIQGTRGN